MFPLELRPKFGKSSMTSSNAFSIIFVKIYIFTLRHICTTTDSLSSSDVGFNFNLRIQSIFHLKVGTFLWFCHCYDFTRAYSGYRAKTKWRIKCTLIFSLWTVAQNTKIPNRPTVTWQLLKGIFYTTMWIFHLYWTQYNV